VIADKSKYIIEPLGDHDRAAFSCGKEPLDRYIRERASQDLKRGLTSVFVIVSVDNPKTILAYYTLSSRALRLDQLPPEIAKKTGKYESVGVTLIGRLAVTTSSHGQGIGALALLDALNRSVLASTQVGSFAVFVEAIDDQAAAFYKKYGFVELTDAKLKLFLPMKTIVKAFQ